MKKTAIKRTVWVLLALTLLLNLCACQQVQELQEYASMISEHFQSEKVLKDGETENAEQKGEARREDASARKDITTRKEPAARKDTGVRTPTSEMVDAAVAQTFSGWAQERLDDFRERLNDMDTPFGVAYLGGFYDGAGGIDRAQWIYGVVQPMLYEYAFLEEIDEAHIIGDTGHLYCIVPKDASASVSVTDAQTQEVFYRSEDGAPILIFANRNGDTTAADLLVTIVAEDGSWYEYGLYLDEFGWPTLLVGEARKGLSFDFTMIEASGENAGEQAELIDDLLADGWLGPIMYSLGGDMVEYDPNGHTWATTQWGENGREILWLLTFWNNSEELERVGYSGEVAMDGCYADTNELPENWQGWWDYEPEDDRPTTLRLDIMLCEGLNYNGVEESVYLSEKFPALLHPNGEELWIGAGLGGACLPFQSSEFPSAYLFMAQG